MQILSRSHRSFTRIGEDNLLYVDKTNLLYKLVTQGSSYFFSRPRRFGKSLTISTLNAIFSGQKALFKDLYVTK